MIQQRVSDSGTWIGIGSIVVSEQYQMREKLDPKIIAEYAEMITGASGWPFADPVKCIQVGTETFLVDGFHRLRAVQQAGEDQVLAIVTEGSKTEALVAALNANRYHGLRRSNADKRKAVCAALADSKLAKWSDRKLADECGVSHVFVSLVRAELVTVTSSAPSVTRIGTNGASRPATKADAETQRQKVVAAVVAQPEMSNRQVAEQVGCSDKTVGKVRKSLASESSSGCVAVADPPDVDSEEELDAEGSDEVIDEPRDIIDMFDDMKQLIREAMHEIPLKHRASVWQQLVEHLSKEDSGQW